MTADEEQARMPSPAAGTHRDDGASHESDGQHSASSVEEDGAVSDENEGATVASDPPLPDEEAPPLPDEQPPSAEDDGWEALWDVNANQYYFYNKLTGVSQWENPRVPEAATTHSYISYDRFANYYRLLLFFLA